MEDILVLYAEQVQNDVKVIIIGVHGPYAGAELRLYIWQLETNAR